MRFTHKAGEKMFVDFSGNKPHYQDPQTGKIIEAELFVSALGASSYIFARAVPDQTQENFVDCTIGALEYYVGCPECIVYDYVPRNIIIVMCPPSLCAGTSIPAVISGGPLSFGHITFIENQAISEDFGHPAKPVFGGIPPKISVARMS